MAADPRLLRFNWRPRVSRAFLGPGPGCSVRLQARVQSSHLACGTHLCAGLDTHRVCWSFCSLRPESFAPRPPQQVPRATRRPGIRPAPAPARAGQYCGRRSPENCLRRLDKRTLHLLPQLLLVVGVGRAMLLVLLSLATLYRSALPGEPVSIPLRRGHPFPRFPSF